MARMVWLASVLLGAALVSGCVGSSGDDSGNATTVPESISTTTRQSTDPETAVAWIESFSTAIASGDTELGASVWSESWVAIGIPMTAGDASVRSPATPQQAIEFLSAWAHVDFSGCHGTVSDGVAELGCKGTVTGPFPDALGLAPFELPFKFLAKHDGLVLFGTDFDAIQGTTNTWPPEGVFYTYEAFYQYAARAGDFASTYQAGIGQPLPTVDAALAHKELAAEWVADGQP